MKSKIQQSALGRTCPRCGQFWRYPTINCVAVTEEQVRALQTVFHQLSFTANEPEEPDPEPEPITCCGEWTWDKPDWVHKSGIRRSPSGLIILVCRKCHKGLLEKGEMTQPLVDGVVVLDLFEVKDQSEEDAVRDALRCTWGE